MPRIDVLVVGAGPAGATAAYHTARAGLSTLLIDRKSFPRGKACGDGLTPRALRALRRLGVVDDALLGSRVTGFRIVTDGTATVHAFGDAPSRFDFGAVVPRIVLDDRIRAAAEHAGAVFLPSTAVELHTDTMGHARGVWVDGVDGRQLVEATLTIVADGASGRLGRQLRGDVASTHHRAFAVRQYWDGIDELKPFFDVYIPLRWRGQVVVGYAWVFPVGGTCANVGLGVIADHMHLDGARLPEMLGDFVEETLRRTGRFRSAKPVGPIDAGAINSHMIDPARVPPGALLVGDAAGLVNAFTAEGIAYAVESGELAGRTAARLLPRRRLPTTHYGRAVVAAYPRHWASRESSRYLRWLMALAPRLFDASAGIDLLAALRSVVLDEAPVTMPAANARSAHWLRLAVRRRSSDLVRTMDTVLAEVVDTLVASPTSVAVVPLVVASGVASRERANDAPLVQGLAAITLLSLAQSLLAGIPTEPDDSAVATASIVIADCLTTEGVAAATRLADASYRRITGAFRESAGVLVGGAVPDARSADDLGSHYVALAAPTRCAVTFALESAGVMDVAATAAILAPFATWYAAVRLATADLRRRWAPALASYLDVLTVAQPRLPPRWAEILKDDAADAILDARTMLTARAAGAATVKVS